MSADLKMHAAICRAVEILSMAPNVVRQTEGREVRDILRQALADYADDFMNQAASEKDREVIRTHHTGTAGSTTAEESSWTSGLGGSGEARRHSLVLLAAIALGVQAQPIEPLKLDPPAQIMGGCSSINGGLVTCLLSGEKPSPILALPDGNAILWADVTSINAYPGETKEQAYPLKPMVPRYVVRAGDSYHIFTTGTFDDAKRERDSLIEQWRKALAQ